MYVLVITLAPYDAEDDPNLRGFILNSNDKDTVMGVIDSHYSGVDHNSVRFYDASPSIDASGSFTTVDVIEEDGEKVEEFRLDWIFEVQETYPQP